MAREFIRKSRRQILRIIVVALATGLLPAKTTASGRVTLRASSDPACLSHSRQGLGNSRMTADKPGSRHQRRSLCRCLGESLDRSNSTPPTGATSRQSAPSGGLPNTTASGRG